MAGSRYDQVILIITFLLTLWASSQFGQLTGQEDTTSVSNTYTFMALSVIVVSLVGRGVFQFIGIKSTGSKILILAAIGGAIGFISTSQGKALLAPQLPAAIDPLLSSIFVLFIAPFVEEYFFRGFLFPTFTALAGNKGIVSEAIGAIVSSLLFVIWHLVAYSNSPDVFISLFIFAMIQCAMVKFTKELAPAVGSHFILNLITRRG